MKKFLILVGILLLLAVVGLSVFIATFDVDRYRPLLISKAQAALGKAVAIEHLGLRFSGGIALQLRGLAIYPGREPHGTPDLKVERATLSVGLLPILKKNLKIDLVGEDLALAQLKAPIERLTVQAKIQEDRIDLENLSARIAGGAVTASGKVEQLRLKPSSTLQGSIRELSLEKLAPPASGSEPSLHGKLSASFQGRCQGIAWDEVSRTLTGTGDLHLKEGVVVNLNVLREVFSRITVIPGLAEILQARLPEYAQEKFTARDTRLEPIDLSATANNGILSFSRLRVATDSLELTGAGTIGLDESVNIPMTIRISPDLSEAMVRSVNELQVFTEADGRLTLPVLVQGSLSHLTVMPDLSYVASRLVSDKTGELLGGLLEKVLEKQFE